MENTTSSVEQSSNGSRFSGSHNQRVDTLADHNVGDAAKRSDEHELENLDENGSNFA